MERVVLMNFTKTIKILLLKKGITHAELAERLGMTPQNLSYRLKRDDFKVRELEKIANFFEMELVVEFKERNS